jgi:cytoskeletal protein CcmA (bactofilin family)
MPVKTQDNVLLTCPRCGHQQPEPPTAFSTVCRRCGQHLRLQEILYPSLKPAAWVPIRKCITCFECGAQLEVATSAESTMCKRCSSYVDLKNYRITTAVSKNYKTKGSFVVEPRGVVFNTEAIVGDAVIKGRFHGKLDAQRSLTIYSSADIKGAFKAGQLIIPAQHLFRWKEQITVGSAEIAGELAASLHAEGAVILKSTARLFGDIEAKIIVVEPGAVVVGKMRIGLL